MIAFNRADDGKLQDAAEAFGKFLGTVIADVLFLGLRGWLLSLCVALFAPGIALSFWQWLLVSFTISFFLRTAGRK